MYNNRNNTFKDLEWREFELGKLFNIYTGGDLILSRISNGDIPVISHSLENNGVAEWTDKINGRKCFNCNTTISLADRGNFYAFVQKTNFYIGTRVKALEAKFQPVNKEVLSFMCPLINKQSVKFSYGNNATGGVEKIKILLPTDKAGNPDFLFMQDYVLNKEQKIIKTYLDYVEQRIEQLKNCSTIKSITEVEWKEFEIREIFHVKSGRRLTKSEMTKGSTPFIGATDSNNGITAFVSNSNDSEDFNILGVNYNGSVVENFYHPYKALFSDDVKRLSFKYQIGNKYLYLFVKNQILLQKGKYQYGYKFNGTRMNKQKIMLPIGDDQNPDYTYMENFMKNIEYEKLKEFLKRKTNFHVA